jgi:exopolysaccharide biosynthesis polyprenyl glycosylphosphotransferase
MWMSEVLAGVIGGGALATIAALRPAAALLTVVGFVLCWRALGTVCGICTDLDARPWTKMMEKAKTTAITGRGTTHAMVYRSRDLTQRTVILGSGVVARQVVDRLNLAPHRSLDVIGLVDDDVNLETSPLLPTLGTLEELDDVIRRHDVDRVIIAFTRSGHDDLLRAIRTCWDSRVAIDIVPRLFEFLDGARTLDQVGGLPMLSITVPQLSGLARALKRTCDIALSASILLVASPVMAIVAALIALDSPGPVLFRQERVGHKGKVFEIFKFRSMYVDAEQIKCQLAELNDLNDGVMFKIYDDPRVTRIGRFLRKASLDELPQLINVLRGEMSLVGPRPLIPEEIEAFGENWHHRRLDLRPGITGPWQIYGRSDIPFHDMLRFDYQYVAGWSLGRDFEILLSTIPVALSGRGAY